MKSRKHHDTETASLVPVLYMVTRVWFGSILRDLEEYCPSVLTTRDFIVAASFLLENSIKLYLRAPFLFQHLQELNHKIQAGEKKL